MSAIDTKTTEQGKLKIEGEIAPLELYAKAVVIKSEADFLAVDERVKLVKRLSKDNDTIFDPTIKGYYEPYVFWRDIKGAIKKRLEQVESACKKAMVAWNDEQERIRKEKEDQAARDAAAKTDKKVDALNTKADTAEAAGDTAKAEELRDKASSVFVAPKAVESTVPKIGGTVFKDNWVGEVKDLSALVKAVAEGRAPANLIMANEPAINKQAKATKDTFKIDGIRFWNDRTVAVSTK